jgi:delta24(24(1))-sterol reductase
VGYKAPANMGVTTTSKGRTPASSQKVNSSPVPAQDTETNPKYIDGETDEFEFGGSLGAASAMVIFPLLMWYMWIGATYYDGSFPVPDAGQSWGDFVYHLAQLVYDGAYPTAKAWAVYWIFFIVEALMYVNYLAYNKVPG